MKTKGSTVRIPRAGRLAGRATISATILVAVASCDDYTVAGPEPGPLPVVEAGSVAGSHLIAHYPLDGDATDASGFGKDGEVNGATPTADRFGNPSGALLFNGAGDFVQTPQGSNFKPLSFSVWFRADDVSGERSIVDSDIGGHYGHSLIIGYAATTNTPTCGLAPCKAGDGTLDVQFHNGAHDTGVPVTPGQWHHAVVSYSGTVDVYLDGVQVLSLPYAGTAFDGADFRFGRHNPGDPQWFKGAIDDVRFFDVALTAQEAQDLYDNRPGAIAYYPLDGDAMDASGFGKDGVVIGATPTADRFGNPSGALLFNGAGDFVQTPQGSNFKPLAFSAWFRADDVSGERSIVDSDIGGHYGHSLIIGYAATTNTPTCGTAPCRTGDGTLDVQFHNGAHDTGVPIVAGRWYHVAVSYSSTVDVYVNGVQVLSLPYAGTAFDGADFRFGRHNPGDPQWFKGAIDEVRFFDDPLTPEDVAALHQNAPPVADPGGPYQAPQGDPVLLDGSASFDPDGPAPQLVWDLGDGTTATGATVSHVYQTDGAFTVTLTAHDGSDSRSATTTVEVTPTPGYTPGGSNVVVHPELQNGEPAPVTLEFSTVTAPGTTSVTSSTAGSPGSPPSPSTADFKLGQPPTYYDISTTAEFSGTITICIDYSGVSFGNESKLKILHHDESGWVDITDEGYPDAESRTVCGTTTSLSPFLVAEENEAPVVTSIDLPDSPLAVGTPADLSASFTDANTTDTHTAVIDWEDGTTGGTVTEEGGAGAASGSYSYSAPGVYTVEVAVTDAGGLGLTGSRSSALDIPAYIVVYDPSAGFVTGGGWFDSPAGACLWSGCAADGTTEGRATFGFVSRYRKGSSVPDGNTEFQFKAGHLTFKSASYDWLVIAGARAQFKGMGTIDGAGDYGFLLTAIDSAVNGGGDVDRFRIKIWDRATDTVVYDNQMGSSEDSDSATALGGGSIVIHSR